MAAIILTDETGNTVLASTGEQSKIASYLLHDLSFAFQHIDFSSLGTQPVRDVNPFQFPFELKASRTGAFQLGKADLTISAGASATIGQSLGDHANTLLNSLNLDSLPPNPDNLFLSFGISGNIDLNPEFSLGDFAFGLSAQKQIGLTIYQLLSNDLPLNAAVDATLQSFTIPASVNDLRKLDPKAICVIDKTGALTFTVSAQYGFFNNPLVSLPIAAITGPLSLNAGGSASLQVAGAFNHQHQITLGKTPSGKLRLSATVTQGTDVDTSFDLSAGLAAHFGQQDPLAFLLGRLSPNPAEDLAQLESALSLDQIGDIKSVLVGALDHTLKAAFHEEFDSARKRTTLFLYEIDLAALDPDAESAVHSALNGNFSPLTSQKLIGIEQLECAFTRITQKTHAVTIHLLGLLNATDVRTYLKQSKVTLSSESGEIVITDLATAQEIKVVDITPDPQQLRRVLLRNATLTAAYKGMKTGVGLPNLACQAVYFLKKANTGWPQMQQNLNALVAVRPALAGAVELLMQQSHSNLGNSQIYLSVALDDDQSRSLFLDEDQPRSRVRYESAARVSMHALLIGDDSNRFRLPPLQDDSLWEKMTEAGSFQPVSALFPALSPLQARTVYTDYLTIAFWSDSMNKCAVALSKVLHFLSQQGGHADPNSPEFTQFRTSLTTSALKAVKDLDSGFDMPWGVLALKFLANPPPKIVARFASSLLAYSDAPIAIRAREGSA